MGLTWVTHKSCFMLPSSHKHRAAIFSHIKDDASVTATLKGRKSMLKLAERIVLSFCSGVGASTAHPWTTLSGSGADDVRVMNQKSMDVPDRPPGGIIEQSYGAPNVPKDGVTMANRIESNDIMKSVSASLVKQFVNATNDVLVMVPPAAEKVLQKFTCIARPNTKQSFRLNCAAFRNGR